MRVASILHLRLTGVANTSSATFTIRIGSVSISGIQVLTGGVLVEPGVYTVDFLLPPTLDMAGDQPIIVTVTADGVAFTTRLDNRRLGYVFFSTGRAKALRKAGVFPPFPLITTPNGRGTVREYRIYYP